MNFPSSERFHPAFRLRKRVTRCFLPNRPHVCGESSYPGRTPYIEDRIDTVESDIAEIKSDIAAIKAGQSGMELKLNRVSQDVAELKAGQIGIRDLLARVVVRLEGVAS